MSSLRLEEVGSRAERTEGVENRRQPGRTETMRRKRKHGGYMERSYARRRRRKQVTLEFFLLRRYPKSKKKRWGRAADLPDPSPS